VGITALGATRETCWALAAIAVAACFRRRTTFPGVSRPSVRWSDAAVLIGLLLIGLYAFSAVWLKAFPGQHTQSESGPDVAARASAVLFVLQALIAIVLAPIFEELMFRGFVFGSLRRWRGVWPAALITGIGFGAIHLPFTSAVLCAPLALFGLGLCLLYARTLMLWPCIVAHSLNNAAAFAATQHLHLLEKAGLIVGGVATLVVVMLALGTSRTIQRQRDLWTLPRA
jgi:membrane protease YdiL (CAAX protease family)